MNILAGIQRERLRRRRDCPNGRVYRAENLQHIHQIVRVGFRWRGGVYMSIVAKVENDCIRLPDGIHLADGTLVTVEPAPTVPSTPLQEDSFFSRCEKYFGAIKDGPSDLAENHDHYLYGLPKKA